MSTKRVTAHTLRHSLATHLLENGTDIRIIQVLLGHTHPSNTAHCTQVTNKTSRATTSPLDRLRLEVTPAGPSRLRAADEVADILHLHGISYRLENAGHLSRGERRVMGEIEACRTPRLGGHVDACDGL